ncbi:hypothetical protein MKX01_042319 [Papaver californicum]|nr:hypothetical protein MKX01_042319 [Papaver californicum]
MDVSMAEQSLSKIQALETSSGDQTVSGSKLNCIHKISISNSTDESRLITPKRKDCGMGHGTTTESSSSSSSSHDPMIMTSKQYLNILQSMGQSVHIFDHNGLVIYWNQAAEHLYGYSASEVLGWHIKDIILEGCDADAENEIIRRNQLGENWTGLFPGRNKRGRLLHVLATNTPFYDDNGTFVGILCVSTDSQPFRENVLPISFSENPNSNPSSSWLHKTRGLKTISTNSDLQQQQHKPPLQAIVSSITSKLQAKKGICKMITSRVRRVWESQQKQVEDTNELLGGNEISSNFMSSNSFDTKITSIMGSGGTTTTTSSSSSSSSSRLRFYMEEESSSYDISWEDLTFGKQVGRGSCATVYHGRWCGSDVAIKVFFNSDYSEHLLRCFREEVILMKRLRHPNVVLFMGEVNSPQHQCIVTEFLPRGSLFQLLRHDTPTLDWERRVQMALDIALGMNYLHCHNPPIVHRDLKSSNLLVDKNWTVKVGDFGLSRLKFETFLTTMNGKGTPQWMAPEVFHNEPVDEKSDVYSFGVILWELATLKIPWEGLNQMQVIAAVGFMDQRNEIPNDTDPHWASLIESSWSSDPKCRPTFKELLERLKDLQRHYFFSKPERNPC